MPGGPGRRPGPQCAGGPRARGLASSAGDVLGRRFGVDLPDARRRGLSRKSKSLRLYDQQFAPDVLVRANLLNLKKDGKICNVPLYAVSAVGQLV